MWLSSRPIISVPCVANHFLSGEFVILAVATRKKRVNNLEISNSPLQTSCLLT